MKEGNESVTRVRGIKWSFRVLASTRAVRVFLRAGAVIKFALRAARTSEI